jgi:hypothetical protein
MKKYLPICLALFLCTGCFNKYLLDPTSSCVPLSKYENLIVSPIDGEGTIVPEAIHTGLPKAIAISATKELIEITEKEKLFKKVILSATCMDNSIKVEARLHSFLHNWGQFTVITKGRIIDCQNNAVLYSFEYKEKRSTKDIVDLPFWIGNSLHNGIEDRLTCTEEKVKNKKQTE